MQVCVGGWVCVRGDIILGKVIFNYFSVRLKEGEVYYKNYKFISNI
jgi:hypothetical protein